MNGKANVVSIRFAVLLVAACAASPSGAQDTQQLAALAVESSAVTCLTTASLAPSVRIVACTAALEAQKLSGNDRASGHLQRAQAYMAVGDEPRAKADFEAAIRLFDGQTNASKLDAQYFLERGIANHAIGDADKALADYAQTIRHDPTNARAYANRGIVLSTQRAQLKDAIVDFTRALELAPGNVDVLLLRADAYLGVSELGAAKADAQRAVELGSDNPRAFLVRGLTLARQGDLGHAFADYSEAIRLEPRYADALANRGAILSMRGDFDNAIRDLDAALASAPRHATAAYNRGYAHFAQRQFDQAMADYTLALQSDPTMGWAYANRGLTRAILGEDLTQALSDTSEALRHLPNNPEVRETRGFIMLKMHSNDAALAEYELALRPDPNRPLALFGRGLARIAKGDDKAGKADQAAARALMPNVDREFQTYGVTER